MDLHTRPVGTVGRDDAGQQAARHRHHARYDDQPAPLLGHLAHALHGNAEIVQHALGDSRELAPCCRYLHPPRAALEQSHAERRFQPLDRAGQRRL